MDIDEALNENFQKVLKDGPRLRMDYNTPVLKRCGEGHILLTGLGGMGLGTMWVHERESHKDYIGYVEAEIVPHSEYEFGIWEIASS